MTRDEAIKSLYCRGDMTKEDIVNKIYDAHEAELEAKDKRIAELEAQMGAFRQDCSFCENKEI